MLSTVEVMNTEIHQWSTAADLPKSMYVASATVCGDQLYMLGGWNRLGTSTRSVYTCSVSALVQSCVSYRSSQEEKICKKLLIDIVNIWRRIADLPVTCSTCESLHGQLLAIGGKDSLKSSTAIIRFNYQLL